MRVKRHPFDICAKAVRMLPKKDPILCRECRHYYITWDPKAPHGCLALSFKSKHLPSGIVFRHSGLECLHFQKKPEPPASRRHP